MNDLELYAAEEPRLYADVKSMDVAGALELTQPDAPTDVYVTIYPDHLTVTGTPRTAAETVLELAKGGFQFRR